MPSRCCARSVKDWTVNWPPHAVFPHCRDGEPRSAGAGGPGLPHAVPPGLPRVSARDDEAVLEEGTGREAHLRVHPVLPGRLLHRHGATVPARGQPLDWPVGGAEVGGQGKGAAPTGL